MTARFTDHPTHAGVRQWRSTPWSAVGSLIVMLVCLAACVGAFVVEGFVIAAADGFAGDPTRFIALGVFGIPLFGLTMGAFTILLFRNARGMLGFAIALDGNGITLRLPRDRSLIHAPPRSLVTIQWNNVQALETREESYRSLGTDTINRVYRLRRVEGDPIFLFEERAVYTRYATRSMHGIAVEMAERAGVGLLSLGIYEGKGGLLGAWGAVPPAWNAVAISPARRDALLRRMQITAAIISVTIAAVMVLRLLASVV